MTAFTNLRHLGIYDHLCICLAESAGDRKRDWITSPIRPDRNSVSRGRARSDFPSSTGGDDRKHRIGVRHCSRRSVFPISISGTIIADRRMLRRYE